MLGVRVEKNTESGKDEMLYAVAKKQETVVREGIKPLVEKVELFDDTIRRQGEHFIELREDVTARLKRLEEQTGRQTAAVSKLLELTTICYGILRHYVIGLFVVRLTKTAFHTYAAGFSKRLELFKLSLRSGNILLDGDYEQRAEEFARGLADATGVRMPVSDVEQAADQRVQTPVTEVSVFDIPQGFPK
jgi:DNA repair exonuclease SbcCD ATPase subunit